MLREVVGSGQALFQRQNQQDLQTHWMWSVRKKDEVRMDSQGFGWDLEGWAGCHWNGRLWEHQPFNLLLLQPGVHPSVSTAALASSLLFAEPRGHLPTFTFLDLLVLMPNE